MERLRKQRSEKGRPEIALPFLWKCLLWRDNLREAEGPGIFGMGTLPGRNLHEKGIGKRRRGLEP
jgi:hypothetical protein